MKYIFHFFPFFPYFFNSAYFSCTKFGFSLASSSIISTFSNRSISKPFTLNSSTSFMQISSYSISNDPNALLILSLSAKIFKFFKTL